MTARYNGADWESSFVAVGAALTVAGLDALPDEATRAVVAKCPVCADRTAAEHYPLTVLVADDGSLRIACQHGCDEGSIAAAVPELASAGADRTRNGALALLVDMADAVARADEPIDYPVYPVAARGFVTVLAGRHSSLKSW